MPSIVSLLQEIPDQFKPLAAIGIGSVILVCLVIFHGISLHKILVHFKRRELRLEAGRPHLYGAALLFGWAIFMMLTLHIVEIMLWSIALHRLGLIVHPADALYFCANAYTTMGYGTVDLSREWRNITPVIAISGLFTFAWTTSSLVTMVQNYMKIVEQLEIGARQGDGHARRRSPRRLAGGYQRAAAGARGARADEESRRCRRRVLRAAKNLARRK